MSIRWDPDAQAFYDDNTGDYTGTNPNTGAGAPGTAPPPGNTYPGSGGTLTDPHYGNTPDNADPWGRHQGDPNFGYPPSPTAPDPTQPPPGTVTPDGRPHPNDYPSPTPPTLTAPPVFQAPDPLAPWTGHFDQPTKDDLLTDPQFMAQLASGMQTIQRSAAAKGTLLTGGTLKGLDDNAVQTADKSYNDLFNNKLTTYNQGRTDFLTNEANRYTSQFQNNETKYNNDFSNWQGQFGQQQGLFGDLQSNQMNNYGIASSYFNQGLAQQMQNFNIFNTTDMNNFLKNYDLAQLGQHSTTPAGA